MSNKTNNLNLPANKTYLYQQQELQRLEGQLRDLPEQIEDVQRDLRMEEMKIAIEDFLGDGKGRDYKILTDYLTGVPKFQDETLTAEQIKVLEYIWDTLVRDVWGMNLGGRLLVLHLSLWGSRIYPYQEEK